MSLLFPQPSPPQSEQKSQGDPLNPTLPSLQHLSASLITTLPPALLLQPANLVHSRSTPSPALVQSLFSSLPASNASSHSSFICLHIIVSLPITLLQLAAFCLLYHLPPSNVFYLFALLTFCLSHQNMGNYFSGCCSLVCFQWLEQCLAYNAWHVNGKQCHNI